MSVNVHGSSDNSKSSQDYGFRANTTPKITKILRFEYIYAFIVLAVLSSALFFFKEEKITMMILGALISSSSAITTFFFTKHDPKSKE